ncbi:MAG: hypothetical protein LBE61_21380 [Burkholderiaceae bacterium]|jgi:hypothetical protein|nr:hypothetical protein [Burkholderiaceae bacterium]
MFPWLIQFRMSIDNRDENPLYLSMKSFFGDMDGGGRATKKGDPFESPQAGNAGLL